MANGDDIEFLHLINQNLGIAHRIARIYFDDAGIREDIIQEMMYQLWRSFPTFDNRSKFSTWMYRVCLNTALTQITRSKRRAAERLTTHHHNIPDINTTEEQDWENLSYAIGQLSKLNRAIVLLYLEDMSYEEIAAITGISRTNVSVRLFRIRKELETTIKLQTE